jgi:hypothetical protein
VQRERNRVIEIEIHPTKIPRIEAISVWIMQAAKAGLGGQKNGYGFTTRHRPRTAGSRMGAVSDF